MNYIINKSKLVFIVLSIFILACGETNPDDGTLVPKFIVAGTPDGDIAPTGRGRHTQAREVVDRKSLQNFVNEAAHFLEHYYDTAMIAFRQEGPWKYNSIYLFILDEKGHVVFHPVQPNLEDQNIMDLTDANGVRIVEELINAAKNGGGFVEYLWDNPAKDGDEEMGSAKVSYATPFTKLNGTRLIVSAGLYPEHEN